MSTTTRALHRADQWEQRVGSGDWGAIAVEASSSTTQHDQREDVHTARR